MRKLFLGALLLVGCTSAFADNGIYVGAGVTQSRLKNINGDFGTGSLGDFRIHDTDWKAIAGVRFLGALGAELNYDDLGRNNRTAGSEAFRGNAKAWSAFLMGYIPVPFVDLYGKVGAARTSLNATLDTPITTARLDESSTRFAYGAGVQLKFGSLGARLEYERLDLRHTDGVRLLTLGATYTFL